MSEREEQYRKLERFANTLAHDLLVPVVSLSSLLALLDGERESRAMAAVPEFASDEVPRSFLYLVRALIKSTQLGAAPALEPVALEEPVRFALDLLGEQIDARQARIEIGPLPIIRGDATLLALLFQNLIGNGLRHNRARRPRVSVDACETAGRHWVSVCDNGIGVTREFARAAFDNPRPASGRAGLGLAAAQRIVRRHGGQIWMEPAPGQGTIVQMEWPALSSRA